MTTHGHTAGKGQAGDPVAYGWLGSLSENSEFLGPKTQHEVTEETRLPTLPVTGCVTSDKSGHFSEPQRLAHLNGGIGRSSLFAFQL